MFARLAGDYHGTEDDVRAIGGTTTKAFTTEDTGETQGKGSKDVGLPTSARNP
jgi:hypothetical protein